MNIELEEQGYQQTVLKGIVDERRKRGRNRLKIIDDVKSEGNKTIEELSRGRKNW